MTTAGSDEGGAPESIEPADPPYSAEAEASVRPRWWVYLLVGIGIAALAFAIGRFSTFGTAETAAGPNPADIGFARDMQVHHTQAIEMAMEIYRKTDDEDVRRMAYDIATSQAGQRGEMFDWLVQWGLPQTGGPLMAWMTDASAGHAGHGGAATSGTATDAELRAAMGMATDDEIAELQDATGSAADCLFLELMIRHHEGAIPMAQAVIELGSVPRVKAVAEKIVQGQQAEIDAMTSMQLRLGCSS
ncbi:DUF305 domain-containing protein [Microbacterium sp. 4R-513]|uniref:DUF305 domain-containing protein n=1 Tax=Microbacterium sp. 4R-513 TaxID=2567934 RepID=UPI0013E1BBA8|nr:DUF305 domain-containing protein [Microbacterium sp. 4R-513]QIG39843.1 DUF305 domain-containing protein [Microbacterium sp. 4R-513]